MSFQCFSCNLFQLFIRGREEYGRLCRRYHLTWFCEVEIIHREEAEEDLPDVTASFYDHQITTLVLSFDACENGEGGDCWVSRLSLLKKK